MDRIEPPKALNFAGNVAENWRRFRQAWNFYLAVADPDEDRSEKYKASLLLTVLGEEARDIYSAFVWTSERDKMDVDKILEKFQQYCEPKKNITYQRYCFFTCNQKTGQTIDQYLSELRQKAHSCEFSTLEDGLLRDRIVCGILNSSVRERLLRENKLTLGKAVDTCRASEIASSQAKQLNSAEKQVDAVRRKKNPEGKSKGNRTPRDGKQSAQPQKCGRCGKSHEGNKCPAKGQKCFKCGIIGHFGSVCRSSKSKIHEMQAAPTEDDQTDFFVDTIHDSSDTSSWIIPLQVDNCEVAIKLDPGANINIMSYAQWVDLNNGKKLQQTNIKLTAYGGHEVPVKGQADVDIIHRGQKYTATFVVTPKKDQTILGLQDCERLGLVRRLYEVRADIPDEKQNSDEIFQTYADVFSGLGCLPGEHHITLDESVSPVVEPCRKIPFSIRDDLEKELKRMKVLNVITEVTEPTEWVSALVIVHKKQGKLRICLDPKNLNAAIRREHFKLPTREEITSKFAGAKVFSKLDACSGFWQMKLDHDSSMLTTFSTPFGRYRFLRLPFGISSAPEVYHRTIHQLFESLPGVDTSMDDMIIWGKDQTEHDANLIRVLEKCRDVGLKLNRDKCEQRMEELTFLGDRITKDGILPDPTKVKAINDMQIPTEKKELQRFLGMVNFLGKYIPDLSTVAAPLRKLLEKSSLWEWHDEHTRAWKELKKRISESPVLKFYDQTKPIKLSSDASQCGLGAVLLQKHENSWLPVAYASRAMSSAETRYAQIEKESLSICFGMEKFHQYVYGSKIAVETDHKPLVAIFQKGLNECPPRIQRFRLRLQKYDFNLTYTPGREMYTADALSRNFPKEEPVTSTMEEDMEVFVDAITANLPMSDDRFKEIREETDSDPVMFRLKSRILSGWPNDRENCQRDLLEYWNQRDELSVIKGVIFKSSRVVIPPNLRPTMLDKIHTGHLGEEKCKSRARELLYWPSINKDIENMVQQCYACATYRNKQQAEPMIQRQLPTRPWQVVATDLFEFSGKNYILIVDYYSNYPEVIAINSQTSETIIKAMKTTFARHGIPDEVVSDNGPCYSSAEFSKFSKDWGFTHNTSSPRYPKSNGLAERTVQTVKNIMKKSKISGEDAYLGLLVYRSTPITHGFSPSQLLMGRRIKSNLPATNTLLKPKTPPRSTVLSGKQKLKTNQKKYHDRKARAAPLPQLQKGSRVRIQNSDNWRLKGEVMKEVAPRSYLVETESGNLLRRNRRDLLSTPAEQPRIDIRDPPAEPQRSSPPSPKLPSPGSLTTPEPTDIQTFSDNPTVRRSGRMTEKPKRLIEEF